MEQESVNTEQQGDKIISKFIDKFFDKTTKEYKKTKEVNKLYRDMIEERIDKTPDVKLFLSKYENSPWIKKVLVNYLLLKMYHHSSLWGIEDLQVISKPKNKKIWLGGW